MRQLEKVVQPRAGARGEVLAAAARSRHGRCRRRRSAVVVSALLVLWAAREARAEGETLETKSAESRQLTPPAETEPVVSITPLPPEVAPEDLPPPPAPLRKGLELWVGATIFPAAVGNLSFNGTGSEKGTVRQMNFSHRGSEIGLRNPVFWGPELRLGYQRTYFGIAASAAFGGNLRADATPSDTQAAALAGTSDVKAYGGGLEIYGSLPLGRITLSAGAAAGLRGFSVPLIGFNPTICTSGSRRGQWRRPCAETATTQLSFYVQPRLRLDVALDKNQRIFLGAYVGLDALGDRSMLGGASLGIRVPGT